MAIRKAFLSSTARDLAEYRDAVYKAISGLDNWKCVRMEDFGARTRPADAFDDNAVRDCDLFIGILGHCYGSIPGGMSTSYTEKEYSAASKNKQQRLMFVAREDFPLPAHLREDDDHRKRQDSFRSRVQEHTIIKGFSTSDELVHAVLQAIGNWENEERSREQGNDGLLPVAHKKGIPQRSADNSSNWRFIESLPEIRIKAYRHAHEDWGTGITSRMVEANYRLVDFLAGSWTKIAEFHLSDSFGGKLPPAHIEKYLQSRFSYHRNKYGLGEPVGPGTMVNVMTGGGVTKDLEDMIFDTVRAISLYNDEFDFLSWKGRWEKTLDSIE